MRSSAARDRSLSASVLNSTRIQPSVSNACRSNRYFASVLIGVRCASRASHVQPISRRRFTRYANIDRANRRLEIGWTWLARRAQRTPINTEAKYLLLRHAFETLGCIRVEFKTDALNERSRA